MHTTQDGVEASTLKTVLKRIDSVCGAVLQSSICDARGWGQRRSSLPVRYERVETRPSLTRMVSGRLAGGAAGKALTSQPCFRSELHHQVTSRLRTDVAMLLLAFALEPNQCLRAML